MNKDNHHNNDSRMRNDNGMKKFNNMKNIKGLGLVIVGLALIIFSSQILLYMASFLIGIVLVYHGLKMLEIKQISSMFNKSVDAIKSFFN
jgi:hypothetical protein